MTNSSEKLQMYYFLFCNCSCASSTWKKNKKKTNSTKYHGKYKLKFIEFKFVWIRKNNGPACKVHSCRTVISKHSERSDFHDSWRVQRHENHGMTQMPGTETNIIGSLGNMGKKGYACACLTLDHLGHLTVPWRWRLCSAGARLLVNRTVIGGAMETEGERFFTVCNVGK